MLLCAGLVTEIDSMNPVLFQISHRPHVVLPSLQDRQRWTALPHLGMHLDELVQRRLMFLARQSKYLLE